MSQKISDARFAKMSQRYEQERGKNAKRIKALRLELKKSEGKRMDIDRFLETVRCYTNATGITQRMVAELIDHIDVYHAEKQGGPGNGLKIMMHCRKPERSKAAEPAQYPVAPDPALAQRIRAMSGSGRG